MNTAIEQLKELVKKGKERIPLYGVNIFTLHQELTFIECRKQEAYFIAMHRYVEALRSVPDSLIGPGRRWMTASHVCRALGITNICLGGIDFSPIDFWGDEDSDTTMDIELDEDTYALALDKAIELFGNENVMQMALDEEVLRQIDSIVCETKKKSHAIVVCPDGEIHNTGVFKFNVIASGTLSRIKHIFQEIIKAGKHCPDMYKTDSEEAFFHYSAGYQTLFDDEDTDLPFFGEKKLRGMTTALFNNAVNMEDLLTVVALRIRDLFSYYFSLESPEEYREKHGVVRLFDRCIFPYGFLFREDVCRFMTRWIGLTWKQSAQVINLMSTKKQPDTEKLKHIYLYRGMDNGFKEEELNHIWESLFDRKPDKPLPSMAHFAGLIYQYAFLAMLKRDFPEEYLSAETKEQNFQKVCHHLE